MPLASTLPTGSKPQLPGPLPTNITRVTLSNGYRAYHPDKPVKPKKTVRFVKGHTTIPDVPFPKPLAAGSPKGGQEEVEVHQKDTEDVKDADEGVDSGTLQSAKVSNTAATVGISTTSARKPAGATLKLVHQNSTTLWRKTPRFRGSGFQQVLDDPVKEGLELAQTAAVRLPSDRWRDRGWPEVTTVRRTGKTGLLRVEEGEREGGFSLGDVVRNMEEAGVVVRVVAARGASGKRGRKGGNGKGEEEVKDVEGSKTQPEEVLEEAVALSEAGSDSESGDDFDFLHDFSLEEAEGWVPVMVAEEDQGDDWMSLTGSWIRLGDAGDAKK